MGTLFITGFPGFIGSALLPRLLARRPDSDAVCLVQRRFQPLAESRVEALGLRDRVRLVEGDITAPELGLEPAIRAELLREVREIFHLAAVYDVTASREVTTAINVEGTRHALGLATCCAELHRFHYVSTFAVSGHYAGVFAEDDLDKGQELRNPYVETKLLAEIEVRRAMGEGLPTTIYRPAMVVGDSDTGETQKLDGPYFVIRWLLRQPKRLAVVPLVGDPTRTRPNIVPRDFLTDAIAYLSGIEASRNTAYQLIDPDPPTLDEVIDILAEATGRHVVRVRVPLRLVKRALESVPGVERVVRIPPEVMDYFDHPTFYIDPHTERDLAGTGIRCPPFESYAANLVRFVERHPELGSGPMC